MCFLMSMQEKNIHTFVFFLKKKSGVIVYMRKKMNEVLIFLLQLCYM